MLEAKQAKLLTKQAKKQASVSTVVTTTPRRLITLEVIAESRGKMR